MGLIADIVNAARVLLCGSDPPIALQEEDAANRAFAICDTNCDGKIDRQQFAFFLRALGAHCALACCFQRELLFCAGRPKPHPR